MTSKPDAIFLADIYRDQIVVKEANKLGIPVIGIADTNSDPSGVDFPIPANDDAIKSLNFVMDQVVGAIKKSR
jgi:small subunit ribosomal protein S2